MCIRDRNFGEIVCALLIVESAIMIFDCFQRFLSLDFHTATEDVYKRQEYEVAAHPYML